MVTVKALERHAKALLPKPPNGDETAIDLRHYVLSAASLKLRQRLPFPSFIERIEMNPNGAASICKTGPSYVRPESE
jgi:hypothetical protein